MRAVIRPFSQYGNKSLCSFTRFLSTSRKVNARVALLGASNPSGTMLSLLLKQNPYLTSLKLYDDVKSLKGMTMDLSHINTGCKTYCYSGMDNLKYAMTSTDILVVNNLDADSSYEQPSLLSSISRKIDEMVIEMNHINNIPIVIVMSNPVDVITALFGRFMYLEKLFDEKKLIGLPTLHTVLANSIISKKLKNYPEENNLLMYGGINGDDSIYFWSENFYPEQTIETCEELFKSVEADLQQYMKSFSVDKMNNLRAYAAHRFISNLAESFLRKRMVVESCYVYHEGTYMTYPCVLGKEGVEQIILKKEIETPKFFEAIKNHINYMEKYDDHTRMLTAIPKSRDDPY